MEGFILLIVVIAVVCWYDISKRCTTLEHRVVQVERLTENLDGRVFALQHAPAPQAAHALAPGTRRSASRSTLHTEASQPPHAPAPAATSLGPAVPLAPALQCPTGPGNQPGVVAPPPPASTVWAPATAWSVPAMPPQAGEPPCGSVVSDHAAICELEALSRRGDGATPVAQVPPPAPAAPAPPAYSEKANRNEMEFAGYYLNVAGIVFLIVGVGLLLRTACNVAGSGVVQTLGGLLAGVSLLVAGDRCYRQNMRSYAHPLVAGGLCVLLLTNCAAHFYFHFIDRITLFASVAAIVAGAGFSVFRYDSRLIGNFILATLYLGPLFLHFGLKQPGVIFAYLVAIHVGTALVAWYKKWDYFLLVSFLGTYTLFFVHFRAEQPGLALVFMTVVYLLFLVSNNLLHFKRRDSSPYNLTLSFVNPMVYAVISYPFLLGMANISALALYLGLAAVHLAIAGQARRRGEEDAALAGLALNNFVLGLLFLTAAISFVTYFSRETACFSVVTASWFAEAFLLFGLALKCRRGDPFRVVLRRFSGFSLLLATAQLLCVVPTMDDTTVGALLHKLAINVGSTIAYLAYASWLHRSRASIGAEERLAMRGSAVLGLCVVGLMIAGNPSWAFQVVAFSALALLMLYFAQQARESFEFLAMGSALLALATVVATLSLDLTLGAGLLVCMLQVALAAASWRLLHAHASQAGNWECEWESYPCWLACALLFKAVSCAPHVLATLAGFSMLALLAAVVSVKERVSFGSFSWVAALVTLYTVLRTLVLDAPAVAQGAACLIQVTLCLSLSGLLRSSTPVLEDWERKAPHWLYGFTLALLFRAAVCVSAGVEGTLLWVLVCLAMLWGIRGIAQGSIHEDIVRVGFFVTFLKSVVLDGNFVCTGGGLQIAQAFSMTAGQLLAVAGVTTCFFVAARMVWRQPELRNFLLTLGLMVFAFQSASVLYNFYGVLDTFQIILSAFWASSAFFFIAFGIHRESKTFRLFGLLLLVSTVLKICVVDIWVLNAYSQTTTFLIMGGLLMAVSFLYQSHRHQLAGAGGGREGHLGVLPGLPAHA